MIKSDYHIPVMFKETLDGLVTNPDGTYVDLTMGGASHSKGILERLTEKGRLFCFDQDADAKDNAPDDVRVKFIPQNFRYFTKMLRFVGVKQVDGILGDLGVSSHQFDTPERGFSIRFEGDLDMRMNQSGPITAKKIVAEYDDKQLMTIFGKYGEVDKPSRVANCIIAARGSQPMTTTAELLKVLESVSPKDNKQLKKFQAQIFQALRIEVNQEMEVLEETLLQIPDMLVPDGRAVIMSYHSLEDRLVKNFFRAGNFEGKPEKDFYGNLIRPLNPTQSKPIIPTPKEIEMNPRARSAKLRIAIKS